MTRDKFEKEFKKLYVEGVGIDPALDQQQDFIDYMWKRMDSLQREIGREITPSEFRAFMSPVNALGAGEQNSTWQ